MINFKITEKQHNDIVIISTDGYLNNQGGEIILNTCLDKIKAGHRKFLIDMSGTKIINSIGVSLLIDLIEELQVVEGKLGFCNLAPIVFKTFTIMGLVKYSVIFETEIEALKSF